MLVPVGASGAAAGVLDTNQMVARTIGPGVSMEAAPELSFAPVKNERSEILSRASSQDSSRADSRITTGADSVTPATVISSACDL